MWSLVGQRSWVCFRMKTFLVRPLFTTTSDLGLMKTRNIDLLLKTRHKQKSVRNQKNKRFLGTSIEKRPDIVDKRECFDDWEINTVYEVKTNKDQALLTLTERKTRYEVIIKIDRKAAVPVNQALLTLKNAAGEHFEQPFKTITTDNGVEFSGLSELLKGVTEVYFTHPIRHGSEERMRITMA